MADTLELEVNGKKWTLGRVGFGIRIDAEEEVRKIRRAEFTFALQSLKELPEEKTTTALLSAIDNVMRNVCVSNADAQQWLDSPSGELHIVRRSLLRSKPDATIEDARELMNGLTVEQYGAMNEFMVSSIFGKKE